MLQRTLSMRLSHLKCSFLGVFCSADDHEYREVIRATWMRSAIMRQGGVCLLSDGHAPGCSVYVTFVIGAKPGAGAASDFPPPKQSPSRRNKQAAWNRDAAKSYLYAFQRDVLLLNITENMNAGKTYEYFKVAAEAFPWATHIGNMDLDTYPHIHKLVTGLAARVSSQDKCESYEGLPLPMLPSSSVCSHLEEGCPKYMQGGLYVMSRGLAQGVTAAGGFWDLNRVGREDRSAGKAVNHYIQESGICARISANPWKISAWEHEPAILHQAKY